MFNFIFPCTFIALYVSWHLSPSSYHCLSLTWDLWSGSNTQKNYYDSCHCYPMRGVQFVRVHATLGTASRQKLQGINYCPVNKQTTPMGEVHTMMAYLERLRKKGFLQVSYM